MPAPPGAAAHPSRAGCWPPSLLPPSRGSCWRVLVPGLCGQQGQPAGQRGLGAPWCWPGEQRSVAARMGVLAQGPLLTPPWCLSFPQAGLSPAGDSAVLVLPPPPSPGRRSSSPRLRYHWGLEGGVGSGRVCQVSRRRVGGSQLSKPSWLPFDPRNPLSHPGTLFLCPPAPPDPRARAPHSWLVPSIPAVRPQKGKATSSERTQKSSRCCRKTARHAWPPGSPAPSGSCRKP